MSLVLDVLSITTWLLGLVTTAIGGHDAAPSTSVPAIFTCNATSPILADFDQDGAADQVARDDDLSRGAAALRLVIAGRQHLLAESAPACRLGVADLDDDRDVDLVALNTDGDLQVWRNDRGTLNPLRPLLDADARTVRTGARLVPSSSTLTPLSFGSLGFHEFPSRDADTAPAGHTVVEASSGYQPVWLFQHLARPPPVALAL